MNEVAYECPAYFQRSRSLSLNLADVAGLEADGHALLGDDVVWADLFDLRSSKGSTGSRSRKLLIYYAVVRIARGRRRRFRRGSMGSFE
jgi:hypothetical protein